MLSAKDFAKSKFALFGAYISTPPSTGSVAVLFKCIDKTSFAFLAFGITALPFRP